MEYNEETKIEETDDQEMDFTEDESGPSKQWFQDNLRVIISVLIVVVIAGGIYSYSRRTETATQEGTSTESASLLNPTEKEPGAEKIATSDKNNDSKAAQQDKAAADNKTTPPTKNQEKTTASTATSQETEKSFVETAGKGDSQTKLARRALANYLEKNPDSSLSPEHKIYIEDYLRKRVAHKGRTLVGTSVEFDKGMIQEAITQAKNLNQKQLQNLHKYAVRVPSLS